LPAWVKKSKTSLPPADWIHFDVMDNHYVPNLTFGPMVCQALKPHAKTAAGVAVPIDVHLMMLAGRCLWRRFCRRRGRLHQLSPGRVRPCAPQHSGHQGQRRARPGWCSTRQPLDVLDWVIDDIDLMLIMSVNPGFGGQSFH
jgi:ribulose-phosphate 3-epimerase